MSIDAIPPDQPMTTVETTVQQGSTSNAASSTGVPTTLSSMEQLQKEAPAVYKAMLEGIAFRVIHEMKEHADRLKNIIREQDRR